MTQNVFVTCFLFFIKVEDWYPLNSFVITGVNASNWTHQHSFQWNKGIIRWKSWFLFKLHVCSYDIKRNWLTWKDLRFNMKRFVKKKLKKHNLFCLISQSYMALNSIENQAEIFSLELCEFILAFGDMITTFTTLSYFHYGDITCASQLR